LCAVFVVGGVIGAGGIIASTEINRQTSTDALCTSCHTMSVVVADPHYQQSAHERMLPAYGSAAATAISSWEIGLSRPTSMSPRD
jgi:flagellar basal body P-ring protein FlgI